MKTLVFLLVAVFTVSFAASANHNRRHGKQITTKNDETELGAGSEVEWPSPGTINEFTIPDKFTGGSGSEGEQDHGSGDEIPPARNHGKDHKRSHKN